MLEKLLAVLPYKAGVTGQLTFYGKRLHQEESIRRLGLVFIVMAFFVQFFAFISPPQPTMARSNNDLIDGGINSSSDALSYCKNNVANYQDILTHYGITCSDIARTQVVSLKSTDYNKQLFSMGRLPYGRKGETPVNVSGKTYYLRYLWSWDTGPYSTYKALRGVSSVTGKTFFILFNCGNLTFVGLPSEIPKQTPVTPPPVVMCQYNASLPSDSPNCKPCDKSISSSDTLACVSVHKAATNTTTGTLDANNTMAKAGDTIVYTLYAENSGKAAVKDFVFQENLNDVLDYVDVVDLHGGNQDANNIIAWPAVTINAGATVTKTITVQVKNPVPQTPVSVSDGGHFDLTMTNTYGNTVNITLPANITKTIEEVATTLPNTGPGTSIVIGFAITAFAAYFFARTQLLRKETAIILRDPATNGDLYL
jgi:uncharacterized repeat protein (TIGR01451 family)